MKISVILAAYNEEQYLEQCLESLAQQQQVDFEVIVVDDGSVKPVQNSKFKIQSRKALSQPQFRFFRIKHSGPGRARNFGAEKAKGDILVFLDGDMTFEPDFLKKLVDPIIDGVAKGTFSTEEIVSNWDNPWARCWNYENGLYSKNRIHTNRSDMHRDFRAILKTEFDRVNGFDHIGYTDTWTLSEKLGYRPHPTHAMYYHYNPSSQSEVFWQAMWIGARKRKLGRVGSLIAVFRSLFFFSLILGVYKSVRTGEWFFIRFKLIYDLGIMGGALSAMTH